MGRQLKGEERTRPAQGVRLEVCVLGCRSVCWGVDVCDVKHPSMRACDVAGHLRFS